ncbi:helix-turn-helix domain-containing protein [Ochrobactrum sp. S1502_03]|uniref:helix-turn-helix domain-containing protein n=1 Tax=Ochrobactrum sp. S1502_03 TaxID=3108451 RepID=UPI0037CC0EF4
MNEKYYTEPEVAEILRCSPSKIKRLRFHGELTYVPGRPVLISEASLNEYLAAITIARKPQPQPHDKYAAKTKADIEAARQWALNKVLLSKPRPKPNNR